MSRNVFQLVSKFLHCHDNESENARRNSERYDPLHKFRLLLNGLNDACKRYFITNCLISKKRKERSMEAIKDML